MSSQPSQAVNAAVRSYSPRLHQLLKHGIAQIGIPLPKVVGGNRVWAHHQLWTEIVWGDSVLRWIGQHVKAGDVFFDVGAHHGWMSMLAAQYVGSNGRVVAFEPSPSSIKFLTYHKRVNRLAHLDIVGKAVSCTDADAIPFVIVGDGNAVMNSLVEIDEANTSRRGTSVIPMETITLDSYTGKTGLMPSVIKIDTEGSELWVCQGAIRVLRENRPSLIVATHPAWLPDGQRIENLFALLKESGYRVADSEVIRYRETDFGDYLFLAD